MGCNCKKNNNNGQKPSVNTVIKKPSTPINRNGRRIIKREIK